MYKVFGLMCFIALPANAQSLMEQVTGAWTLTSGYEIRPDGTKNDLWQSGNLILDSTGHMSLFVISKDRKLPAGVPDPRVPVGPIVAYFGRYTVDDIAHTMTYNVDGSAAPAFTGVRRTQTITVNSDSLVTKGNPIRTPQGMIVPILEWQKLK